MSDLERKFGKYAVRDLSLKLIILYLVGYAIYYLRPQVLYYMTLNPYAIIHGQVWRIISWLLIPPQVSNIFFMAIMLFFYYSIGTSLERVWGTWRYNVFIFTGILLTVAAAFVWMGFAYLTGAPGALSVGGAKEYFGYYSLAFSTYYINMGIFFAYALTFPDAMVLMFFIIPVKVKWLGILDLAYLLYEFFTSTTATRFAILATFINIGLLYWRFKARESAFRERRGRQQACRRRASGQKRRDIEPCGPQMRDLRKNTGGQPGPGVPLLLQVRRRPGVLSGPPLYPRPRQRGRDAAYEGAGQSLRGRQRQYE